MGRQTESALTDRDEVEFLAFLRSVSNIQLIRSFAPTEAALFVDHFEPREEGNWMYYIWNKAFPWKPTLAKTRSDLPKVGNLGLLYVANTSAAPLLEYSRHKFGAVPPSPGRLYWAKHFSAPDGLSYDVAAFESWYESIARWLRRHSNSQRALTIRSTRP